MVEILVFGGLIVAALSLFAVVGLALFALKFVLLLVLLPVRLALGLLVLPFRLAGALVGLMAVPVLVVAGGVALLVGGVLALILPFLPVAAVFGLMWLLARSTSKPAAA
jgi:hypothetical protein